MADVAGMDTVLFDPIEGEYEEGGSSTNYAPPAEGKYFAQVPMITDENFSSTREGYLSVSIDPLTIVNPAGEGNGYQVRFTRLSAKKYSNRNGSQVMDFLRACGLAVTPKSSDEAKQYLKACSGKTVQFALGWEAYDKDAQVSTKGQDSFPLLADGTRQSWVPSQHDPQKRVFANGKVRFFISAVK